MEYHGAREGERKPPVPTRPAGITFLAGLQVFAAVFSLVIGLAIQTSEPKPWMVVFVGGMAALFTCCAYGLWALKPQGRTLQLLLAWIGLAAFPAGTLISIPILNYLFRPSICTLFAGESAGQSEPAPGATQRFESDIVFSNGKFVRWPEQMQP